MTNNRYDIAVIGGGIMGCSTTFHLAKRGADVILLEKNSAVGLESSGVNAGSICIQNKPFDLIDLAIAASDEWQSLSEKVGYDVGYHRVGGFRIAENSEQLSKLRRFTAEQRERGLPVEELSSDEVRERAPYITGEIAGANFCPLDGHADSLVATDRIAQAAMDSGAKILTNAGVSDIERSGSGYKLSYENGYIEAGLIVITSGIWSREIAATLGVNVPLKLRNNQIMIAQRSPKIVKHMITHADGNLTLKQLDSGTIVIGGGLQGHGNLSDGHASPSLKGILANARAAFRVMPELGDLQIIRSWAGFDGRTVDQLPIMGPLPDHPQIHILTSCFGGFVVGPLVGRLMAQNILEGQTDIPIDRFSFERYTSGEIKSTTF